MIQWILLLTMTIINFIFMNLNHPLAMGLILLLQTTLVCLYTGFLIKSFWFSYILFLVFLGGMLVLFIYVTSLASNEMFSMSMKLIMNSITLMLTFTIMLFVIYKNLLMVNKNMEMQSIFNMNLFYTENALMLNKLYNYPNNLLTILLMNYLLITLIAVVKITNLFKGPLRPMFN